MLKQMIADVNYLQNIDLRLILPEDSGKIMDQLQYFENEFYPTEQWFDEWKRKNGEEFLIQYEECLSECNIERKNFRLL